MKKTEFLLSTWWYHQTTCLWEFYKKPQRLQNATYCLQAEFLFKVVPIKTSATLFLQTFSFLFSFFFYFSLFSLLYSFTALLHPLRQFFQLGHLNSNAPNVLHDKTNINCWHDYCTHEKIFYFTVFETNAVPFMDIQNNLGTFPPRKPTFF